MGSFLDIAFETCQLNDLFGTTMKCARKDLSLLSGADEELARCKRSTTSLNEEQAKAMKVWLDEIESMPDWSGQEVVDRHYAIYKQQGESPADQIVGLRGLLAGICVAASAIKGQTLVTADSLFTPEDGDLREVLSDNEALHAVEECRRRTQEAEEKVKQLQADKDKVELDLLAAQDTVSILEKTNAKLSADLAEAQRLLSDSKTQPVPVSVTVPDTHAVLLAEVRKALHETISDITNLNRGYIREKFELTDAVADAFRAMENRPAVLAAIVADDEARPIWKLVTAAIHLIPS